MPTMRINTYGVWHTEARQLPQEDEPGPRDTVIIEHYLGRVRFDAWRPPLKAGWISCGVPPEER